MSEASMFSFIVSDETCPTCAHKTSAQDAVHFAVVGTKEWTTASANAPLGAVTADEVGDVYPDESVADLLLSSANVVVTCVKCGTPLAFTAEKEER